MDGINNVSNLAAKQLAEQLAQLQIQYIKQQLLGEHTQQLRQQFIQHFFAFSEQIKLKQLLDLEQLIGVVEEQVFNTNLAPSLLAVIGEMAESIHQQIRHSQAPLTSFVSDQQIEHWLRKALEMDYIFDYFRSKIIQTPQIRAMCAYWINQNLVHYTPEQLSAITDQITTRLPRRLQQFLSVQQQRLEEKVEEKAAHLFQQQLLFLFHLPKEEYLSLGLSLWNSLKDKPLAEFSAQSSPLDSEEIFIFIYEFWKDLRKNPDMQTLIKHSIEQFYHAFADESLYYLFQSTGLKVDNIQTEAERFVPVILTRLDKLEVLDQVFISMVAPFFNQTDVLQTLEHALKNSSSKPPLA